MNQIANSFDQETVNRILRSAMWSALAGLTAFLTSYLQTSEVKASIVTGILAMLAPLSANSVYQYQKGD